MTLEQFTNVLSTATMEESIESSQTLTFEPPVYIQRYIAVKNALLAERWQKRISKIVDFGCGELKFFKYIKHVNHIQHYYAVDLDEAVIRKAAYEAKPLIFEYINGFSRKLIVDLFVGSIAVPDSRLNNVDAVVCIELIEHLYPDVLEKVPSTVFKYIQPEVAIFTTPNADFNVLFNLKTFRHDDHKFEWTRKEFEDWCISIIKTYQNYDVHFDGIGQGPKGTEYLGCCSQMAIFSKKNDLVTCDRVLEQMEPFKLYKTFEYPYKEDERSELQQFIDEVKYRINNVRMNKIYHSFQRDDSKFEIPISYLSRYFENWCSREEIFVEKLQENGYLIQKNEENLPCLIVDEESDIESEEFSEDEDYIPICDINFNDSQKLP